MPNCQRLVNFGHWNSDLNWTRINLVRMINDGAITMEDLLEFSDELKDKVKLWLENM